MRIKLQGQDMFSSWIQTDCSRNHHRIFHPENERKQNHKDLSIYSRLVHLKDGVLHHGKSGKESVRQELATIGRNLTDQSNTSEHHVLESKNIKRIMSFSGKSSELDVKNLKQNILHKMQLLCSIEDVEHFCDIVNAEIQIRDVSIIESAELVQDIYKEVTKCIEESNGIFDISTTKGKCLMNDFEERFTNQLHDVIFSKIVTEELKDDDNLSSTIENLNWVTTNHLSAHIVDSSNEVRDLLDKAMLAIAAINLKSSTVEKLDCIMECSRHVSEVLKVCHVDVHGADEFFPALVYVVLQANPANLHSNIRYILQFSNNVKLLAGERGYYFTHLCSAVRFIEDLDPRSLLSLSEKESYLKQKKYDSLTSNELGIKCSIEDKITLCDRRPSLCICKLYHKAAERTV